MVSKGEKGEKISLYRLRDIDQCHRTTNITHLEVIVQGSAFNYGPRHRVLFDHFVQRVEGELDGGDSEEGDQVACVGRQYADGGDEE